MVDFSKINGNVWEEFEQKNKEVEAESNRYFIADFKKVNPAVFTFEQDKPSLNDKGNFGTNYVFEVKDSNGKPALFSTSSTLLMRRLTAFRAGSSLIGVKVQITRVGSGFDTDYAIENIA